MGALGAIVIVNVKRFSKKRGDKFNARYVNSKSDRSHSKRKQAQTQLTLKVLLRAPLPTPHTLTQFCRMVPL